MTIGSICIIIGLLIWKKQKVNLVNDNQHKNVRPEDIPAYTRLVGIGIIVIGVGIVFAGVFNLMYKTALVFISLAAGFIYGMYLLAKAQKKYNGSLL